MLRQRLEALPHNERVRGAGVALHGTTLLLLVNDRGSFSFVTRSPDGFACLLAAGENWEDVVDPEEVEEEPGAP